MEDYKKKYEEALENFKRIRNANENNKELVEFIEYKYPELKYSEDEEIRYYLINFVKINDGVNLPPDYAKKAIAWLEKQGKKNSTWNEEDEKSKDWILEYLYDGLRKSDVQFKDHYKAAIAWLEKKGGKIDIVNKGYWRGCRDGKQEIIDKYSELEKQGEQTPSDKVEPRFHEGDWVVYKNDICQIVKREEGCNKLVTVFGIEKELVNERNLSTARLWTIKDAKDGDVLSSGYGNPFIFSGFVNNNVVGAYCGINRGGNFYIPQTKDGWTNLPVLPATKEQRDYLFSKMKEAGYEWDAEKNKLKKIEPKPAENKGMNLVEEEMTPFQKKVFFIIDTAIEEEQGLKQVCDELLRLAHDEIMQNPAWSEEDEKMWVTISDLLWEGYKLSDKKVSWNKIRCWLRPKIKFLKERYTWKPTDEQMQQLGWIAKQNKDNMIGKELMSLYQDLKKLKGE